MNTYSLYNKKIGIAILMMTLPFICKTINAQLKLYPSGSLSIGSISQPPANTELQVIGNSVFSNKIGATTSSAYIKGLNAFSTDSVPDYSWFGDTLTGIFHPALNILAYTNTGKETMRLTSSNNLLIGSTSDNGDRIQVTGSLNTNPFDIYSNSTLGSGYSGINWLNDTNIKAWTVKYNSLDKFYVYGNGQAYAYGWNTISDSTLKENVSGISHALDKVLRLQGVTYNLKQSVAGINSSNKILEYPSSRKMGLIAQAVERVAPEVVTTTSDGIKTVAYGNLVGLLIEAIKEEDLKVTNLQHKLDSCIVLMHQSGSVLNKEMPVDSAALNVEQAKLYPCKTCPAKENTSIHCFIPATSKEASILVFDINGILKKSIPINGKKEQFVSINDVPIAAGLYYYSLIVDGQEIDTKKIILTE